MHRKPPVRRVRLDQKLVCFRLPHDKHISGFKRILRALDEVFSVTGPKEIDLRHFVRMHRKHVRIGRLIQTVMTVYQRFAIGK